MKKYELYVMPGSKFSQEAERLLEKSGLVYEKIVVDNVELMNAVVYEFGIKKAPALYADLIRSSFRDFPFLGKKSIIPTTTAPIKRAKITIRRPEANTQINIPFTPSSLRVWIVFLFTT